jgi:histone H3/H4
MVGQSKSNSKRSNKKQQRRQQRQVQQQASLAFKTRGEAAQWLAKNTNQGQQGVLKGRHVPLSFSSEERQQILSSSFTSDLMSNPPRIEATCPECDYEMDEDEVNDGFLIDNTLDYSTQCPECYHRFITRGVWSLFGKKEEFPLLCANQTKDAVNHFLESNPFLAQVTDAEKVEVLSRWQPALAWNALWHERGMAAPLEPLPGMTVAKAIERFLFGERGANAPFKPLSAHSKGMPQHPFHDDEVLLLDEDDEERGQAPFKPLLDSVVGKKARRARGLKGARAPLSNKISKAAVKRIAKRSGVVKQVASTGASRIQDITADFVQNLVAGSTLVMMHRKAKGLQSRDTDLVMQLRRNAMRPY